MKAVWLDPCLQTEAAQLLIKQNWLCLSSTCVSGGVGGGGRHTCAGTVSDDWCPHCASGVKNTRHPRDFLFFLSFFHHLFYFLWKGSKEQRGGERELAALQKQVDQQTCITQQWIYHPLQPSGTCRGHEQLVPDTFCSTWRVRCYRLGRIRPRRTAIITTRDLNLNREKESKRKVRGKSPSRRCPSRASSQKSHPPKERPQKSPWQRPLQPPPSLHCLHVTELISQWLLQLKHLIPSLMRKQVLTTSVKQWPRFPLHVHTGCD